MSLGGSFHTEALKSIRLPCAGCTKAGGATRASRVNRVIEHFPHHLHLHHFRGVITQRSLWETVSFKPPHTLCSVVSQIPGGGLYRWNESNKGFTVLYLTVEGLGDV